MKQVGDFVMKKNRIVSLSIVTEKQLFDSFPYLEGNHQNQLDQLLESEMASAINDAVESLQDRRMREVAKLYFYENKTTKEIGILFGITQSELLTIISRIKTDLKKSLQNWKKN